MVRRPGLLFAREMPMVSVRNRSMLSWGRAMARLSGPVMRSGPQKPRGSMHGSSLRSKPHMVPSIAHQKLAKRITIVSQLSVTELLPVAY